MARDNWVISPLLPLAHDWKNWMIGSFNCSNTGRDTYRLWMEPTTGMRLFFSPMCAECGRLYLTSLLTIPRQMAGRTLLF